MKKIMARGVRNSMALSLVGASMLVACGGGGDTIESNGNSAQLLANGEACHPAWIESKQYAKGAKVSYKKRNYTAAHATNWDNPLANHTQADGDPWIQGFTCGGTTTTTKATTSTTKATTSTTKLTTTTTKIGTTATTSTTTLPSSGIGLNNATKKEYAMQIVSSAENSSTNWRAQFSYIEDIGDGRGYTAGIIGFCSGTSDMLELVTNYTNSYPSNGLAKYLPALRAVDGSASHAGLDPNYKTDWAREAGVTAFQRAQEKERDDVYFNPSVAQGKADGIRALGQFAYYDAAVVHGFDGMKSVRTRAMKKAKTPAQGGNEITYLNAFMDERVVEMMKEEAHSDVSRIETAQRVWLKAGNLDLNAPLSWKVYGDPFSIK